MGPRGLRAPPRARTDGLLPGARGPLHLPLRLFAPARALAHRAAALPPRPARLLLRRLARPLLPRRGHALDALRGGTRERGPALLRRPPRGFPGRAGGDVPPLLARRRERHPRRLDRAPRGGGALREALPRSLGDRRPPGAGRDRGQRADGPLQDPQCAHEGPLPPHGGDPGLEGRAHRLERLLAHRRRDGLRVPLPRPPLHRLRRVDEHPRMGRRRREPLRDAGRVPRPAVRGRAAGARRPSSSARAAGRTCSTPWPRARRRSPRWR